MAISLDTLKYIIYTLVFVILFTGLAGFTMFFEPQQAYATGFPVVDIAANVGSWIIHAIGKMFSVAWDGIKWVAEKAWDQLKIAWEWARENAFATLMAAASKIVAKFLLDKVQKLIKDEGIESYLYYADFLVRSIYATEYITKHYDGDVESQLILSELIDEGKYLYGRLDPNSSVYQIIKNKTTLKPECQTYNYQPAQVDYYVRVLEGADPNCSISYTLAAYRDATLNALSESKQAAQEELRTSGGFKSSRSCGSLVSKPGQRKPTPQEKLQALANKQAEEQALPPVQIGLAGDRSNNGIQGGLIDINGGGQIELPEVETPEPGETIDILPSASSLICGLINYPGGSMATLVNQMVDQVMELSFKPKNDTATSAQLRSFLSNTMATTFFKLLPKDEENSVIKHGPGGSQQLASGRIPRDDSFVNEVPSGIDANKRDGDVDLDSLNFGGRDQVSLSDYWSDMCGDRLTLLYALRNNHYQEKFKEIDTMALRNDGVIKFGSQGNDVGEGYFGANQPYYPFIGSNFQSNNTYAQIKARVDGKSIEYLITTSIPFDVTDDDNYRDRTVSYNYIWQILDPVDSVDPRLYRGEDTGKAKQAKFWALGRRYFMGQAGFPTPEDVEQGSTWVPPIWPYFIDDNGRGYQYVLDGTEQVTVTIDGITFNSRVKNVYGNPISRGKVYTVSTSGSTTVAEDNIRVFQAGSELIAMNSSAFGSRQMWKLNKGLTVNVDIDEDGEATVITNLNNLKLASGEIADLIEFRDSDGSVKVLSAQPLDRQSPCENEPFGPPSTISDLETKLNVSRAISTNLWNWIGSLSFLNDSSGLNSR